MKCRNKKIDFTFEYRNKNDRFNYKNKNIILHSNTKKTPPKKTNDFTLK